MNLLVVNTKVNRKYCADLQIAIPIVPPKERTLIIKPLPIEISSCGIESCATVTRVIKVIPKPHPSNTGYPHTADELSLLLVAMHMKKTAKRTKATNVASRTVLVIEQYSPAASAAKITAMKVMLNRTPTMRTSASYNTLT